MMKTYSFGKLEMMLTFTKMLYVTMCLDHTATYERKAITYLCSKALNIHHVSNCRTTTFYLQLLLDVVTCVITSPTSGEPA